MENKCQNCDRSAEYKLIDKEYCKKCYVKLIEQKIRHNLRKYDLKKDSTILAKDDASEFTLKKIINMPVSIVKKSKKPTYHAITQTLDDENEAFLDQIIFNKKTKQQKNTIKLFYPITRKDLKNFLAINGITYDIIKTEITLFIDSLEEKHPGTKNSLLKSKEKLAEITCN